MALDLSAIHCELVDDSWKGVPGGTPPTRIDHLATLGWNVSADIFPLPLMVLRQSALEHNIAALSRYCRAHGALFAPHGKTTMAPQLFHRQLAAGAWALTAATVQHVQVYRRFGVDRILIANQVIGPPEVSWLAHELRRHPDFDVWTLVDSPQSVLALAAHDPGRPWQVLVEVGYSGGRTGARDAASLDATIRAIAATGGRVQLAGTETYEGLIPFERSPQWPTPDDPIRQLLERVAFTAEQLHRDGLLPDGYLLTAGGSQSFDAVVEVLGPVAASTGARLVLRSGAYVGHDHGRWNDTAPAGMFRPALELWARVLSTPEPGLALCGFGKRDAPYDAGFPVALAHPEWQVVALNDQHAHVRFEPGTGPSVGDRVVFGISHSCSAFDRWPLLLEVDDDYNVVDAIRTFF